MDEAEFGVDDISEAQFNREVINIRRKEKPMTKKKKKVKKKKKSTKKKKRK